MLPFPEGKKLAVVGPHAYSTIDLMEDYRGDQQCFGGGDACVPTIAQVFTNMHGANLTTVEEGTKIIKKGGWTLILCLGVDMDSTNASGIAAAIAAVQSADYVVLCIGIGLAQEHEGIDRINITLPGLQVIFRIYCIC